MENEFFLRSITSKITLAKEKERKIERTRRKKTMVALLVFIMATLY